jgi:hypothetical protein
MTRYTTQDYVVLLLIVSMYSALIIGLIKYLWVG